MAAISLRSCTFIREFAEGCHFINGQTISNNSPKLILKKCRFAANSKNTFNLKSDFLSVDLNDQVFYFDRSDDRNRGNVSSWMIVVAVTVPAVALVAIAIVVVIIKKKKLNNKVEEKEMNAEVLFILI